MVGATVSNQELAARLARQNNGDCHKCVCEDSCSKRGKCENNIFVWLKGARG